MREPLPSRGCERRAVPGEQGSKSATIPLFHSAISELADPRYHCPVSSPLQDVCVKNGVTVDREDIDFLLRLHRCDVLLSCAINMRFQSSRGLVCALHSQE